MLEEPAQCHIGETAICSAECVFIKVKGGWNSRGPSDSRCFSDRHELPREFFNQTLFVPSESKHQRAINWEPIFTFPV